MKKYIILLYIMVYVLMTSAITFAEKYQYITVNERRIKPLQQAITPTAWLDYTTNMDFSSGTTWYMSCVM